MATPPTDSRTVDFAVVSKTITTGPSEISGNVITLDPVSISSDRFDLLFYYKGDGTFAINARQSTSNELLLSTKTIGGDPFNLTASVISFYESDIGETINNWEFDKVIKIRRELLKLHSIIDFTRFYAAMNRRDLTQTIINDGGVVNGAVVHRLRLQIKISNESADINDIFIIFQFDVPLKI